jgi:hypothetical protein
MTTTKIAVLKEAAEKAAVLDHNEYYGWYQPDYIESNGAYYPKNARFIALCSPSAIISLIDEREALKSELAELYMTCLNQAKTIKAFIEDKK